MIYQESETVEWKSVVVDDITALQSQIPRSKLRGIDPRGIRQISM